MFFLPDLRSNKQCSIYWLRLWFPKNAECIFTIFSCQSYHIKIHRTGLLFPCSSAPFAHFLVILRRFSFGATGVEHITSSFSFSSSSMIMSGVALSRSGSKSVSSMSVSSSETGVTILFLSLIFFLLHGTSY